MDKTPKKQLDIEVPPGDEPHQVEDQARIAKLAAEEALIREQLKRAQLENKAAEREARSWHARYTFVPSPWRALQAIGAGIVLVIAFFVLYQPLVDIMKKESTIAELDAEIQQRENQKLSQELDERKKQQKTAERKLQAQEERYTVDLKKMAEQLKSTEENLNEAVQLAQQMKTQLQERTAEYEGLAKASKTEKTEKSRYQQLARKAQTRAKELEKQLASLQNKARTAKELAAQVQKEVETRPGRVFRDRLNGGGEGPEMIILAAGSFLMGSPESEKYRRKSEGPQYRVSVSQPFALSVNEITFAEYDTFTNSTERPRPDDRGWGRGDRPVINVSWEDATAYARWLSEQTGQHYRLPTEAEWEYAVRAGSTTAYSFSDDSSRLDEYAWFDSNSGEKTHSVGKKKPNAWGLKDMHGNVWEWVEDDWHDDYKGAPDDGRPRIEEDRGAYRVIRGGGWGNETLRCRSAIRNGTSSDVRSGVLGFRLSRSVSLGP